MIYHTQQCKMQNVLKETGTKQRPVDGLESGVAASDGWTTRLKLRKVIPHLVEGAQ